MTTTVAWQIPGAVVTLDETSNYPELLVTLEKHLSPLVYFECVRLANHHRASLRFVRKADGET